MTIDAADVVRRLRAAGADEAATLIETLVREIAGMRSMDAVTMRRAREQSHLRDARIKSMRKELKRQARDLAVHRAIVDTLITRHTFALAMPNPPCARRTQG